MTKEALKLALEALEGVLDDAPKVLDASISGGLYEVVQCRDAITAIKEALAQEQEPVGKFAKFTDNIWREVTDGSAGVPLYTTPSPCPTCEALARTVMLDQTSHDTTLSAGDIRALKHRIHELESELIGYKKIVAGQDAMLERQTARIVELQEHIENFDGEDR